LVASSTQRLVILFAWAFPFAVLTNWSLFSESQWTVWVSPPLVAMPIIIIMAQSSEYTLIGILTLVSIASNVFSIFYVTNTLARSAILVQGAISLFGTIILFIPSETYVKPPAIATPSPILPVQKIDARLRHRKFHTLASKSKILHF
jgi:glucose-6-phosphate-specific signal transduction histidine kinase